jgi:hypothetical protein
MAWTRHAGTRGSCLALCIIRHLRRLPLSPDEVRALVGRYIDAYNNMDVAGMFRTVHPNVEFKNISNGTVNARASGIEELRAL